MCVYGLVSFLAIDLRSYSFKPDLYLKRRRIQDAQDPAEMEAAETTVCRICNDVAEDAIQSTCHHVFDRACIQQYIDACATDKVYLLSPVPCCNAPPIV
jgi:DNA repair protein RAD16